MVRTTTAIVCALVMMGGAAMAQVPATADVDAQHSSTALAESVLSPEESRNYRLGTDDKVRIITYDEPQLTGEFFVNSNGNISLPLAGEIPAKGKTVDELRSEIETTLKSGYLKNPSVSVEVLTFRPYYILGEVNKPGEYPYTDRLTVFNAVATAGGFTYRANQRNVFIKHQEDTVERKAPLTSDTQVSPGDTIRIVERYF